MLFSGGLKPYILFINEHSYLDWQIFGTVAVRLQLKQFWNIELHFVERVMQPSLPITFTYCILSVMTENF